MRNLASTPRPVPKRTTPALAAALTLAVALPIFLIAGWDVRGWALGAIVWATTWAISYSAARMREGKGDAANSGLQAFELAFKAIVVLVVLAALAASKPEFALSAILVFALAYTVEFGLSLTSYFGGTP